MKAAFCFVGALLLSSVAVAQQAPPTDPMVATFRQLLSEANDRVAALSAQVQRETQAREALQKQLDEMKKPPAIPPKTEPPK